ncbi:2OG-Fe(II) oxygenase [Bacillus sp. AFS041924]|uniref:2OG-Fe(II) oxygenase n=1 Tax=Bacillus sp. AFS041924 TaxID=2033503 RepID=UPI000BFD76DD|nr:2OG-Fe(II) oxygenase [Bacillus sp. AFS041924]PGS47992.1 2OG-Fe(II) oxygenase [Bacillus sp. AFS041924]
MLEVGNLKETEQTIFNHIGPIIHTIDRKVEILTRQEEPLIVLLGNVLSDQECDELINHAKSRMKRSKIGLSHEENEMRTSSGMFFDESETELIKRIEKRIEMIMNIPIEHAEPLQVLHYEPGQQYKPHFDYFSNHRTKNNRISTLLLYLNDVEEGGETIFPELNYSVSAKKGTALYFEYFYQDETINELTIHAGSPVITGEKWVATQWMRRQRIR